MFGPEGAGDGSVRPRVVTSSRCKSEEYWRSSVKKIRLQLCFILTLAFAGCQSTQERVFSELHNGLSTPQTNWREQFEVSVDEYTFEYKFYYADESYTATYGNMFAVASVLSYSTPGHLFNDMNPDDFVQDVESLALSIRNQPVLLRAERIDRAFDTPSVGSTLDEKLNWVARAYLIGEASAPLSTPGYLYQFNEHAHLVVTRMLSLDEIHKINYVVVDNESKLLMSASLKYPRRVKLDESVLENSHRLVWHAFASR